MPQPHYLCTSLYYSWYSPFLIMINVMSVALSTKVKMTENGLIIETGGGDVVTIPKDEVKSKNILCIEKTGWGTRLRIWHKSN
jgi:hypothetical protein